MDGQGRTEIGSFIAWLAMKGAVGAASLLPLPVLFSSFRGLAAACRSLGIRRRVVRENLRAAFGKELGERERDEIERECYAAYGRIVAEVIASDRLVRAKEERFDIRGLDLLEEARRAGTGALILTAHIGNFIVGAHYLGRMGHPFTFVAKKIANRYVNREIETVYCRNGHTILSVQGFRDDPQGGLRLFRSLRRGDIVVALVDQDAGPRGYKSAFFGLPTYIPDGPVRLAHRCGAPVMTAFANRDEGRIRVDFQPRIDYSAAGSPEAAEKIVLDEYSRRLEEQVRRNPGQYFWFHKKWKSVPEILERYKGRG